MSHRFPRTAPAVLVLLAACSGGSSIARGTPDGRPDGQTARVAGHAQGGASSVQAWRFDDGAPTVVGEGSVADDGSYTIEVPADTDRVVIDASADGAVVGSVIVATTGEADGTVTAAPMSAETTLEAQVYAAIVDDGADPEDVDVVDLRARLDARAAAAADADADAVGSLAIGIAAAQEAEAEAWADAGVDASAQAALDAEASAAAAYDAALDAGTDGSAAFDALLDGMADARASLGLSAAAAWEAEAQAGLAARLYVEAAASADAEGVADGVALTAGAIEAHAAASAAVEAAASDAAVEAATVDAAAALEDAADAAASSGDAAAMASAWASFRATLAGPASSDTAIEGLLDLSGASSATDVLVDTAFSAAAELDASVAAEMSAAVTSDADASAVAGMVTSAWAGFAADTRANASLTLGDSAEAEAAAELLLLAAGGYSGE